MTTKNYRTEETSKCSCGVNVPGLIRAVHHVTVTSRCVTVPGMFLLYNQVNCFDVKVRSHITQSPSWDANQGPWLNLGVTSRHVYMFIPGLEGAPVQGKDDHRPRTGKHRLSSSHGWTRCLHQQFTDPCRGEDDKRSRTGSIGRVPFKVDVADFPTAHWSMLRQWWQMIGAWQHSLSSF